MLPGNCSAIPEWGPSSATTDQDALSSANAQDLDNLEILLHAQSAAYPTFSKKPKYLPRLHVVCIRVCWWMNTFVKYATDGWWVAVPLLIYRLNST